MTEATLDKIVVTLLFAMVLYLYVHCLYLLDKVRDHQARLDKLEGRLQNAVVYVRESSPVLQVNPEEKVLETAERDPRFDLYAPYDIHPRRRPL